MKRLSDYSAEQLAASSDLCQLLAHFLRLPTSELAAALVAGSLRGDLDDILSELGVTEELREELTGMLKHYESDPAAGIVSLDDTVSRDRDEDEDRLKSRDRHEYEEEVEVSRKRAERCEDEGSEEAALLKELRVDYTQMFGHPTHPSVQIYESLILYDPVSNEPLPRLFTNATALDCEDYYIQAGLKRSTEVNESGDHLATQLQFLSYLYGKAFVEMQANSGGIGNELAQTEDNKLAQTLATLQAFEEDHVQKWAEPFFTRMLENAQTAAYRACALAGRRTLCS